MNAPLLQSERLIYKPLSMDHLSEQYVSWLNDKEVNAFTFSKMNHTIRDLEMYLKNVESNPILFWAIQLKDSLEHIGNIKIDPIDIKNGYGEYGILVGEKNYWGKGYAKEASESIIGYCFKEVMLRKINLHVGIKNTGAIKLYFKLGFQIEGIFKSHFKYNYGFDDVLRMAIFNPNLSLK